MANFNFHEILARLGEEKYALNRAKKAQEWAKMMADRDREFRAAMAETVDFDRKAWEAMRAWRDAQAEAAEKSAKARRRAEKAQEALGLLNQAIVLRHRLGWFERGRDEIRGEYAQMTAVLKTKVVEGQRALEEAIKKYEGLPALDQAMVDIMSAIDELQNGVQQLKAEEAEELRAYEDWYRTDPTAKALRRQADELAARLHKFFPGAVVYRKRDEKFRLKPLTQLQREKDLFLHPKKGRDKKKVHKIFKSSYKVGDVANL